MSVISRVMEGSPSRGTDRMVLTVLAYRADVAGLCFPSNRWTAKRAGISEAAAGRTIRELERAGELIRFARVREDGGQSSNLILLARYADRAALDDYIAQGGQCAALIREYLAENPTVCPLRHDVSPPPSGMTPPPVQGDAPPPSGVTGHDSILYPICTPDTPVGGCANGAHPAPTSDPVAFSHPAGTGTGRTSAQPTSKAKAGGVDLSAAPPPPAGTRVPDVGATKSPPAWAPFYDAVSETLGGMRVVKAGTGAPLAWVGELARIAGAHVNGSGPVGAAALWREFTESRDWQFAGNKPTGFPAAFGKWVGQRRPEVNAYAHIPVVYNNPEWVEGDPLPF